MPEAPVAASRCPLLAALTRPPPPRHAVSMLGQLWRRAGVAYRAKVGKELASHGAHIRQPCRVGGEGCGAARWFGLRAAT